MIPLLLLAAVLPAGSCRTINSDRIYARDLAAALPLFASLPPDLAIGYSPAPGWQRTFHAAELQRLANTNHLPGTVSRDVCFAWSLAVPEPADIVAAMKKSLAGRDVRIEVVDRSRQSAPLGDLVFPLAGASVRSSAPVLWRGYVAYSGNRRFTVWASVLITVKETHVVASNSLHPDEPILENDIRAVPYEGQLPAEGTLTDVKAALGMIPRRPIAAGDQLVANMLEPAKDVVRGDTVEVLVNGGGALIKTAGIAEESGNRGATIVVRNITSGRKFRARVEDKDKVSVVPGVANGLIAKDEKS
jgi:flagella basal body P-ring formation protein FlgA